MNYYMAQCIDSQNLKPDRKQLWLELESVGNKATMSLGLMFMTFRLSRQ
jgi:hypothetical protein